MGETAAMESVRSSPAPPLRGLIAWYQGYRQRGQTPGRHRGVPSPYLTMIVTFDDPLVVAAHPDPNQPSGEYDTLLGGLHTTPALITHEGRQSGIQLAIHPLAAPALFGLPAGELARIDVDAAEVLGGAAAEMRERVQEAVTWEDRFAALDEVLLRLLRADHQARPELKHAWRRSIETGGGLRTRVLAEETGWSETYLERRFRAEIGLTPKALARVTRFDNAKTLLQRRAAGGESISLVDLAVECGYYDQAHLAREFRQLAGCPPSRWLTDEFENIQAMAAPRDTTSQYEREDTTTAGLAVSSGA